MSPLQINRTCRSCKYSIGNLQIRALESALSREITIESPGSALAPESGDSANFFCSLPKRCPSVKFSYGYVAAGGLILELDRARASRLLRRQIFVGPILRLVANVNLIVGRVGIDVERLSLLLNGRYLPFRQHLEFLPLFGGGRDLRFEPG